ncbi:hypothetical protein Mapa_001830 [Marchantia paleacea]|nr:hypothetical protein Mapa_001830 [Marchantia paleacea]
MILTRRQKSGNITQEIILRKGFLVPITREESISSAEFVFGRDLNDYDEVSGESKSTVQMRASNSAKRRTYEPSFG